MQIYELNPAHWREWRDLRLRLLHDDGEWFAPAAYRDALTRSDADWWAMAHDYTKRPNLALVAVIDDKWIGCMRLAVHGGQAWVHGVWVDPVFRGGDVADELLGHLEDEVRDVGYRTVSLSVNILNHRAIAFYERRGFAAMTTRIDLEYDGKVVGQEMVMVKCVPEAKS